MSAPADRALVIGGSLAGLFAGLLLRRKFAAEIAWREGLGIEVETRRFFERDGRLGLEYPYRQTLTAWDRLYDLLRRAFPSAHYHRAKELVAVEERPGSVAARFADGSVAEGDLLIGADGLRSTVRSQFLPAVTPIYVGYAAWRALIPEHAIAPDLHAQV